MKPVMQNQFAQVPRVGIPRSQFDRSHTHKTTFDAGWLVPIFVDEAYPGDTFNLKMTGFARMATPIKPVMDNQIMSTFFFAVPNRLIWENWERFNGAQDNPGDSTDFTVPTITKGGGYDAGHLFDYMGLPVNTGGGNITHSALFGRAYNLIWNEWFRDQNLQDSVSVPMGDGPDNWQTFNLLRRGKRHDYFTSCLPWPQKGEAVNVPIGTQAPVTGLGFSTQTPDLVNGPYGVAETGGQADYDFMMTTTPTNGIVAKASAATNASPEIYADLTQATAITINDLREAFQLQKMLEKDARGGTRYTEKIRAHFGVISPDQRLQRPEFLGGGSSPINIRPVEQTQATSSDVQQNDTPQGNLAAYGTAQLHNHGFTKSFTEHCIIIGLVNVRADLTYQQGINRMWSRQTQYDYYWPSLAFLGEQEVLNKEIYAGVGDGQDNNVFGYQERWAELRYKPSQITGLFRSDAPQSLDVWHLSQDFGSRPVLGPTFIEDNPPIDRVIALQDEPHYLFDSHFSLKCARPMPMNSVPGNIDRF